MPQSQRITFDGSSGEPLAARLELPTVPIRAFAIFAHCFSCSKDLLAVRHISSELRSRGIAVLRFDFTGLGGSAGDFANTNFSSNVEDLRRAAAYLGKSHRPPEVLIGHSLGGAAVLAAASGLPAVKAVVTIGAPADTEHVIESFRAHVPAIENHGEAVVELAGRPFTIRRQFLRDVAAQNLRARIHDLHRPLLILHSPMDEVVGIGNAKLIFEAARHPKSFVALDNADHLLSRREDAVFVAELISAWCGRYLEPEVYRSRPETVEAVRVYATGEGRFQQMVKLKNQTLIADEPVADGGLGTGPTPYDFLSIGLGACTSMTLQLYAEHKGLGLPPFSVEVHHAKVHAADCATCVEGETDFVDRFQRTIRFEGELDEPLQAKALQIANKCPVHRTLESRSRIVTAVQAGLAPPSE